MLEHKSVNIKPHTHYAKSGQINIAYQVYGKGSTDIIYIPGWISNIDLMWDCKELVYFFNALAQKHRLILFDKRGTGLSDRMIEMSTIEERMDDIRAVMDDVGSERAVLFGHSEGGSVSALFAATYPNRTIGLVTFGAFAKREYSKEYPWAPTMKEREKVYTMIQNHWGSGDMGLETLAPSKANDKIFMDWLARYFRSGASPSAALVLTKMNTGVDIIDILPSINVPTLVMQRKNDIDVKIEEGRFISKRITNAQLVEFEGNDHLFWAGKMDEVLDTMLTFIANIKPYRPIEKQLLTVVYATINTSHNEHSESYLTIDLEKVKSRHINNYRGHTSLISSNSIIAFFDGPRKAVHCFLDLQQSIKTSRVKLKAGIHMGECYLENGKLKSGHTLEKVKAMVNLARESEILISQSVKHILPDTELEFLKINKKRNVESLTPIFKVIDPFIDSQHKYNIEKNVSGENSFIMERVLKDIYKNINDDTYSVESLSKNIGISERQLQRKIKAISNKSPNQLIRSVRLHRAKELLNSKSANIAEVAFMTGFSDASYFSRCFKSEFGMSPSAFK